MAKQGRGGGQADKCDQSRWSGSLCPQPTPGMCNPTLDGGLDKVALFPPQGTNGSVTGSLKAFGTGLSEQDWSQVACGPGYCRRWVLGNHSVPSPLSAKERVTCPVSGQDAPGVKRASCSLRLSGKLFPYITANLDCQLG